MSQSGTIKAALLMSAAALLTAPSGASAQQAPDGGIALDEISVTGQGEGSATGPVDGYVAQRTTTGSKTDTPIAEIPQSISVVGRAQIDDQGARKFDEALRYTAGVFAQPFGADSDTNWLYIRGFDATATGVYRDGLQLYSYGFGGFFTDSFLLERIEVLRGASSALYGSGNPGGVVNLVGKRPTGERLREIEVGIDDYPNAYLGFDAGDTLDPAGVWSYRLTGKLSGGDGNSRFEDGFQGVIQPVVTWAPTDATKLTVYGSYQHMDQTHGGGSFLPYFGTVKRAAFGRIDRDANFTEPDLDSYDRRQFMLGSEFEHRLNDQWKVNQNVRYAYSRLTETSLYPFGYLGFALTPQDPDNQLSRINFAHDTRAQSFTSDTSMTGVFDTGALNHTLLFGVDYKFYRTDQWQASTPFPLAATPISADDPVYGAPQPARANYLDQDLRMHQVGAYVQDQVRFGGGWIATLNGRYDRVWIDADNRPLTENGVEPGDFELETGRFSGRAGLGYAFANGITPYASVATFFDPVVGNNPLGVYKPQTGEQFEVGVKYVPTWFPGLFTASLFNLTKQNVVVGPFNAETQVGEIRSRGFELEAQANLTENWKVLGAFTAYELEVTDDADPTLVGKQPFLVPEVMASAFVDYTFTTGALTGVSAGAGVRYLGKSYADALNTLKVPDAKLFDAAVRYKKDNWGVSLNVTNLFDKSYVSGCQSAYTCSYGEGRKALVKANYTW